MKKRCQLDPDIFSCSADAQICPSDISSTFDNVLIRSDASLIELSYNFRTSWSKPSCFSASNLNSSIWLSRLFIICWLTCSIELYVRATSICLCIILCVKESDNIPKSVIKKTITMRIHNSLDALGMISNCGSSWTK